MREEGIEPTTAGSGIQRSTTELFPHATLLNQIVKLPHANLHTIAIGGLTYSVVNQMQASKRCHPFPVDCSPIYHFLSWACKRQTQQNHGRADVSSSHSTAMHRTCLYPVVIM